MTTALATIDTAAEARLAALLGADPASSEGGSGEFMPFLKLNYDDEDDKGNEIKKGLFLVSGQDPLVYAKSVKFRPLAQMFQWAEYDSDEEKYVNRTINVPNMRAEARDMKGTIRCGKPASKVLAANPDLAKQFKAVKANRKVYGLVSYSGETSTGEKVEVQNLPVVLGLKGANFMPFEDEYVKKLGQGRKIYDYEIELTSKREKNGGTTFFVIQYAPDFKTVIPLDADTFATMEHILKIIQDENAGIEKQYQAALTNKQTDEKAVGGVSKFLDLELNDDPNDDLPF